jgi:hypothetical protein
MIIVAVLVLVVAAPVSAREGGQGAVGERINILFQDPTTFDANTPFHVFHGFAVEPSADLSPVGRYTFRLEVDGVDQGKGQLVNEALPSEAISRRWLFNFQDGLPAGDHLLEGRWYEPCSLAVDLGEYPGPCATPNEPVEIDLFGLYGILTTLTVTFS